MAEAVRLVIWDLDETFWKGTVTEGGIAEYVQAHHDIVIELARRGILSSICSKNDEEQILQILRDKGIADYFIFPSINWESKGARLASLIEAVQLRPATVMFIDDNPGNRGEAGRFVPDLQIEDETFIGRMLDDPRFAGKNDEGLTRLAQYKLLETRKQDESQASGGNEEFLRSCDIRVHIEYDVMPHIDRAIELINRTNQLNFTKKRLPEDIEQARTMLAEGINDRCRQSGLVHVSDRYGDYGFVGFFMLRNGAMDVESGRLSQTLLHYCFSCRTLGMLVEAWLYDRLQRPGIAISGEVLTDLSVRRDIDWIRLVPSIADDMPPIEPIAPEIRVHGGCEAVSFAHYLHAYSEKVVVTGNFHAGSQFVRVNGVRLLLSACDRAGPVFRQEAEMLRIPYEMLVNPYFEDSPEGTVFVFGGQLDADGRYAYRHKVYGWEIRAGAPPFSGQDVTKLSHADIDRQLAGLDQTEKIKAEISAIAHHIHDHYDGVPMPGGALLARSMDEFFARIPLGSKAIVITDKDRVRTMEGMLRDAPLVTLYNAFLASVVEQYPFARIVSFADAIASDDEIQMGGNHYDRKVYSRLADGIVAAVRDLPAKVAGSGRRIAATGMTFAPEIVDSYVRQAAHGTFFLKKPVALADFLRNG